MDSGPKNKRTLPGPPLTLAFKIGQDKKIRGNNQGQCNVSWKNVIFLSVPRRSNNLSLLLGLKKRLKKAASLTWPQWGRAIHNSLPYWSGLSDMFWWFSGKVLGQALNMYLLSTILYFFLYYWKYKPDGSIMYVKLDTYSILVVITMMKRLIFQFQ